MDQSRSQLLKAVKQLEQKTHLLTADTANPLAVAAALEAGLYVPPIQPAGEPPAMFQAAEILNSKYVHLLSLFVQYLSWQVGQQPQQQGTTSAAGSGDGVARGPCALGLHPLAAGIWIRGMNILACHLRLLTSAVAWGAQEDAPRHVRLMGQSISLGLLGLLPYILGHPGGRFCTGASLAVTVRAVWLATVASRSLGWHTSWGWFWATRQSSHTDKPCPGCCMGQALCSVPSPALHLPADMHATQKHGAPSLPLHAAPHLQTPPPGTAMWPSR
jgi:hypothetical protein